jgi:hypothetical protein
MSILFKLETCTVKLVYVLGTVVVVDAASAVVAAVVVAVSPRLLLLDLP